MIHERIAARFCGSSIPSRFPVSITSTDSRLWIEYRTSTSPGQAMFAAKYEGLRYTFIDFDASLIHCVITLMFCQQIAINVISTTEYRTLYSNIYSPYVTVDRICVICLTDNANIRKRNYKIKVRRNYRYAVYTTKETAIGVHTTRVFATALYVYCAGKFGRNIFIPGFNSEWLKI